MELIKFKIGKLFGMYDIQLDLKNDVNIYVGENGLGKTTVLNCLYYMLTCNFEKLRDITFESIQIYFEDAKPFKIYYKDIVAYIRGDVHHLNYEESSRYYGFIDDIFSDEEIEEMIEEVINEREESFLLRKNTRRLFEVSGLPPRLTEKVLFRYCLERFQKSTKGNAENVVKFMNFVKENSINNVIYFPTYRRIEKNILNMGRRREFDEEIAEKELNNLIHFGMNDVTRTINNNLEKIRSLAISGYNQMTGLLLEQYTNADIEEDYQIDINKLNVALARMGERINSKTKNEIMNIVSGRKSHKSENKYLFNLLRNLIKNYEDQNKYDQKIRGFVNTCNKYLNGKKIEYNESEISVRILNDIREININNLSSGEKQIISIFSKLYLDSEEESILLIDEPELSLSIKWQSMLIPDIVKTNKCKKIIAVTHSPFIFENEYQKNTKSMKEVFKG